MDYGDGEKGVALLNRGLPGNNVEGGVVMLSLLKCTALKEGYGEGGGWNFKTKTSDGYELGVQHEFEYALAPHQGDWRQAQIIRRGMEFNRPLIALKVAKHPGRLPRRWSLVEVEGESLAISALRHTPQGTVVRVYETEGRQEAGAGLRFAWPVVRAEETNLIEQEARSLSCEGKVLRFEIGPFEIKTFRVALDPGGG
jgi:alpha-mannosidase